MKVLKSHLKILPRFFSQLFRPYQIYTISKELNLAIIFFEILEGLFDFPSIHTNLTKTSHITISSLKISCFKSKDARVFFRKKVFTFSWSYKNVGLKKLTLISLTTKKKNY